MNVGAVQGPSAEEQLAEELQEAIAEARSHQRMAAQQPHTHRQTWPYQPEVRHPISPSTHQVFMLVFIDYICYTTYTT